MLKVLTMYPKRSKTHHFNTDSSARNNIHPTEDSITIKKKKI